MGYLDTRDLKERQEELQILADAVQEAEDALEECQDDEEREELQKALDDAMADFGDDEKEELEELDNLESEIPEWSDGNTLIPEDEFTDYVQEMISDIGDLPRNIPWYIVIDWEATAENIKADYSTVEYQGETYLFRCC
jgi:hypothetical protein